MPHPAFLTPAAWLLGMCLALTAQAIERVAPQVDTSTLPAQARTWAEPNPLRGDTQAIAIGQAAFNQSCAKCHGETANGARSPAPDLRRLGTRCKRIADDALRQRCLRPEQQHHHETPHENVLHTFLLEMAPLARGRW